MKRKPKPTPITPVDVSTAPQLLASYVERVERLREEIGSLNSDVSDLYGEAKSNGFDVPVLKRIIKHRARDTLKASEQDAIFDTYLIALEKFELEGGTRIATRVHAHEKNEGRRDATGPKHAAPAETTGTVSDEFNESRGGVEGHAHERRQWKDTNPAGNVRGAPVLSRSVAIRPKVLAGFESSPRDTNSDALAINPPAPSHTDSDAAAEVAPSTSAAPIPESEPVAFQGPIRSGGIDPVGDAGFPAGSPPIRESDEFNRIPEFLMR